MPSFFFITFSRLLRLTVFVEQETEGSWIHWMFAYGNILFFIGKLMHLMVIFFGFLV